MRVAIVGSGGREHALAWKVAQSDRVDTVVCMPGNAGTELDPRLTSAPIDLSDVDEAVAAIVETGAHLVVVGPEAPLVDGLADKLRDRDVAVVGPSAAGARLEGSKAFAKTVMERAGVPTARAVECRSLVEVEVALASFSPDDPPVVKADGLAAGKGVLVCETVDEVRGATRSALVDGRFGEAGSVVLLEERLRGVEASYIVLTDGRRYAALPTTQDHKRLLEDDRGPNTGGMGAYLPNPFVDTALDAEIRTTIIEPVLETLRDDGIDYRGFLFAGLMLTESGPKVLEFNVRSGDPETQPLMFGLEQDLVPVLMGVAEARLEAVQFTARPTAAVVLAAEGYPGGYEKGRLITGLEVAGALEDVQVFHAGTRRTGRGVETSGGRVLAVCARAETLPEALGRAYSAVAEIRFDGHQFRPDIGRRAL